MVAVVEPVRVLKQSEEAGFVRLLEEEGVVEGVVVVRVREAEAAAAEEEEARHKVPRTMEQSPLGM